MLEKSTWDHLRFHISFALMPVFLTVWAQSRDPFQLNAALIFISLHFLAYPAATAINGYYDRDEGSIHGVRNPNPVTTNQLVYVFTLLSAILLFLSWFIHLGFFIYTAIGILMSIAYSHPLIRLKSNPIGCLISNGLGYGYMTVLGMGIGLEGWGALSELKFHFLGLIFSTLSGGILFMLQVYQQDSDKKRGENSISIILGVQDSFTGALILGLTSTLQFVLYLYIYYPRPQFLVITTSYILCLFPMAAYFIHLFRGICHGKRAADFNAIMTLTKIPVVTMTMFNLWLIVYRYY